MNLFKAISDAVEKETGLQCVYETQNISDEQICVNVQEIEQTGESGKYQVNGSLTVKTTQMDGWSVLSKLLNLELTGTRATSTFSDLDGFNAMSVDFSVVVQEDKGRTRLIRGADFEVVD